MHDDPSCRSNDDRQIQRHILTLCDLEKKRLGQDIHDGIGQQLTGIRLLCKALQQRLRQTAHPEAAAAESLADMVERVILSVREIVAGMVPPEIQNQDAAAALDYLCRRVEQMYQIRCVFSDLIQPAAINHPDTVRNLYFIAAEAIHNAIRHGQADQVVLRLCPGETERHGKLIVQNNGICHENDFCQLPGLGVSGMRCRAQALQGRLSIEKYPDQTLAVICFFHLHPPDPEEST